MPSFLLSNMQVDHPQHEAGRGGGILQAAHRAGAFGGDRLVASVARERPPGRVVHSRHIKATPSSALRKPLLYVPCHRLARNQRGDRFSAWLVAPDGCEWSCKLNTIGPSGVRKTCRPGTMRSKLFKVASILRMPMAPLRRRSFQRASGARMMGRTEYRLSSSTASLRVASLRSNKPSRHATTSVALMEWTSSRSLPSEYSICSF